MIHSSRSAQRHVKGSGTFCATTIYTRKSPYAVHYNTCTMHVLCIHGRPLYLFLAQRLHFIHIPIIIICHITLTTSTRGKYTIFIFFFPFLVRVTPSLQQISIHWNNYKNNLRLSLIYDISSTDMESYGKQNKTSQSHVVDGNWM